MLYRVVSSAAFERLEWPYCEERGLPRLSVHGPRNTGQCGGDTFSSISSVTSDAPYYLGKPGFLTRFIYSHIKIMKATLALLVFLSHLCEVHAVSDQRHNSAVNLTGLELLLH